MSTGCTSHVLNFHQLSHVTLIYHNLQTNRNHVKQIHGDVDKVMFDYSLRLPSNEMSYLLHLVAVDVYSVI